MSEDKKDLTPSLMETEYLYKALLETSSEAVTITNLKGKIIGASERAVELSGAKDINDLIGRDAFELISQEDRELASSNLLKVLKDGSIREVEYTLLKIDGTKYSCIMNASIVKDKEGKPVAFIGTLRDITAMKKADKALRTSEKQFQNIYNNALVGLWTTRLHDGVFLRANQKCAEILGFNNTEDIINKMSASDFFNLEERKNFIQALEDDGQIIQYESKFTDINGKVKYLSVSAKKFKKIGILEGVFIDITEKKNAQKALYESHNMLQLVMNNIPQSIFWKNRDLEYMGCNLAFAKAAGVKDPEDIIGKNDYDLAWTKEEADYFREVDKRVMESDTSEFYIVEPVTQSDGKQSWADTNKIPIHDTEGKVIGVLGMYEDITEKMETEDKIEESEAKFQLITEQSLMAITIIQDNVIKYINQAGADIIGIAAKEIKSWPAGTFISYVHPEDRALVMEQAQKKQEGRTDVMNHYHYRVLKGGTEPRWIDNYSKTILYRGRPADLITGIDITERYKAEKHISESEEQYRTTIDSISDALHVIDKEYNIILLNQTFKSWLEELELDINVEGKKVFEAFPFLSERVREEYEQVFRTGGVHIMIDTIIVNGKEIITETRKFPILRKGNVDQIITVVRNITEQRRTERKLKESQEQLTLISSAVEQTTEGVAISDVDGILLYLNRAFANSHGYEPEELIGKHLSIFHTLEQLPEVERANLQIQNEGWFSGEIWHKRRDNTVFPTIMNNSILRDDRNNPIGMVATTLDITERKNAEDIIKESEQQFRTISEQSLMGINIIQNNKVQYVNQRSAELFGFTREEIINWPPGEFAKTIHPDDLEYVMEHVRKRQSGLSDDINHYQYRAITKSNETIWLDVFAKEITYKGNPATLGTIINISEKVIAEQKLLESEERYRTLIENSPDFIFIIDKDENMRYINKLQQGFTLDQVLGRSIYDFVVPQSRAIHKLAIRKVFQTGRPEEITVQALGPKGQQSWYDDRLIPLEKNGEVNSIMFISKEITDMKIAQERLRVSEARYRTILENINEGYFEVDLGGTFTFYNRAFSEILGFSSNDLIGKNYAALLDEKNAQKVYTHYNSVYTSTAENNTLEYEALKKNGEKIYIDTSAYLRYDPEGKIIGFYGLGRDITDRKKSELIIEQENISLKTIDQIRKDLISRVSHELKTPLIPILGGAELLLYAYKDQLGEEPLDIIKLIEKGGNRLKELVEKLLDISRIEFNKLELDKKEINLTDLVKGCIANLKYTIDARKLKLSLNIPESFNINLDEVRIEQVVTNLLTNAIKNTPPDGIIEINIETYQNLAILSVKDTGVGLTDEEMRNLFTRFGKIERYGDDMDYIDIQGSGLGLYISKQIVDLHEGKIWADSDGRHKGATFTIRLPIK